MMHGKAWCLEHGDGVDGATWLHDLWMGMGGNEYN